MEGVCGAVLPQFSLGFFAKTVTLRAEVSYMEGKISHGHEFEIPFHGLSFSFFDCFMFSFSCCRGVWKDSKMGDKTLWIDLGKWMTPP